MVFDWESWEERIHQKGAIIIDAEHKRYWSIICTESTYSHSQFESTFNTMLYGFTIDSVPGPTVSDVAILIIVGGIIAAGIVIAVAIMLIRKSKRQ